jgi:NitT/TauT family transport system substrate-binding protein
MSAWGRRFLSIIVGAVLAACCLFGGCHIAKDEITVYMPDGAPSVAFAKMMSDDTAVNGITYKVVAPNLIKSKVTAKSENKNADICVLPILAAAKLLGNGDKYQTLGVITHGNLYFIAKEGVFGDGDFLSSLVGKTVGVLQIADVPGLTLKSVLSARGIAYQEVFAVENAAYDTVNLLPITGAKDVGAIQDVDAYLLAEPAVSAKVNSPLGFSIVGDLQALYGGENGYPQAVVVAKKSLIEQNETFVKAFMRSLSASTAWLSAANGESVAAAVHAHLEDAEYTSTLVGSNLKQETLLRCGARFVSAMQSKMEILAYLERIRSVDAGKTGTVSDAFFCALDI